MTDWLAWHAGYDDPHSSLARRLPVVQELLEDVFSAYEGGRLRLLSLCAGEGRDVLPLVERWCGRTRLSGRLIEHDARLVRQAQAVLASNRIPGIEVLCGDAGRPESYVGAVPADLVVACGIFGNVDDGDVRRVIRTLPALCAEGGQVIWTRHRRAPDLTPAIRSWFAEAGFEEQAFRSPGPGEFSVGRHRLARTPEHVELPDVLFTFTR